MKEKKNAELYTDDAARTDVPLAVNCVGYQSLDSPFRTRRRRRDYYVQFMETGHIDVVLGGEIERLSQDQFIIYEAGRVQEYFSKDSTHVGYYWVHFTGAWAKELIRRTCLETGRIYTASFGVADVAKAFEAIFLERAKRSVGHTTECAALLARLMVRLERSVSDEWQGRSGERFSRSLTHIHKHFTTDVDVDELAAMEHLSASRFRCLFKSATGMSPTEYVINLRMDKACQLLTDTESTVSEIAAMCGYSNVLYFIRIFKKKKGITPGKYREKYELPK
jgi:AraC-like DNA-binding protein